MGCLTMGQHHGELHRGSTRTLPHYPPKPGQSLSLEILKETPSVAERRRSGLEHRADPTVGERSVGLGAGGSHWGLVPAAGTASPDDRGGLILSPAHKPWPTTASCWSPSAAMPGIRTGPVSTDGAPHPKCPGTAQSTDCPSRTSPQRVMPPRGGRAGSGDWVWRSRSCHGQVWDLGQHLCPCIPLVPLLGQSPAPRPRGAGRDGRSRESRAEPDDSGLMAFPDVGENKQGFLCDGRCARQAGQDGAGWELSARSNPVPSHPTGTGHQQQSRPIPFSLIMSCPTSPMGPRAREGRMLGWGCWGRFFLWHRDSAGAGSALGQHGAGGPGETPPCRWGSVGSHGAPPSPEHMERQVAAGWSRSPSPAEPMAQGGALPRRLSPRRDRPLPQQPRGPHLPQGRGQVEQNPRAEGAQWAGDG